MLVLLGNIRWIKGYTYLYINVIKCMFVMFLESFTKIAIVSDRVSHYPQTHFEFAFQSLLHTESCYYGLLD